MLVLFGALTGALTSGCSRSCSERAHDADNDIAEVVQQHQSCAQDGDCVLVSITTDCRGNCQAVVAATGADAVRAAIEQSNADHCEDYAADGCPYATPGCAAVRPVCVQGACDTEFQ